MEGFDGLVGRFYGTVAWLDGLVRRFDEAVWGSYGCVEGRHGAVECFPDVIKFSGRTARGSAGMREARREPVAGIPAFLIFKSFCVLGVRAALKYRGALETVQRQPTPHRRRAETFGTSRAVEIRRAGRARL